MPGPVSDEHTTPVLPYARGEAPRRCFHAWLLPLAWLPGGWGSRVYHGDEYFGFLMANLPGGLLVMPLFKVLSRWIPGGERWFPAVIGAGLLLCAAAGWLLDRLGAWRWVYLLLPVAFLGIVLSRVAVPGHVPPLADYPGQQWEPDAVCVAYCWAVYLVAAATLLGAAAARVGRALVRRTRRAAPARSAG
jgi:hypothetical protein